MSPRMPKQAASLNDPLCTSGAEWIFYGNDIIFPVVVGSIQRLIPITNLGHVQWEWARDTVPSMSIKDTISVWFGESLIMQNQCISPQCIFQFHCEHVWSQTNCFVHLKEDRRLLRGGVWSSISSLTIMITRAQTRIWGKIPTLKVLSTM